MYIYLPLKINEHGSKFPYAEFLINARSIKVKKVLVLAVLKFTKGVGFLLPYKILFFVPCYFIHVYPFTKITQWEKKSLI